MKTTLPGAFFPSFEKKYRHACEITVLSVFVSLFVLNLEAGLLARSPYPEGPATGHLDTGFSWFPCV